MGISPAKKPPRSKKLPKSSKRLFNNLADYAFAKPQAPARAWNDLLKASAEWHSDARLKREREVLAEATKYNLALAGPWNKNSPFTTLESPPASISVR